MKKYTSKLLILASLTFLPLQAMEQEKKIETNEEKVSEILKNRDRKITLEAIKKLINDKFNFNYEVNLPVDDKVIKTSFLHLIVSNKSDWIEKIKIFQYFIEKGADVTKVDSLKNTVLHVCTNWADWRFFFNFMDMAQVQINNKKNFKKWIDEKDNSEDTALVASVIYRKINHTEILLAYGADSTITDEQWKKIITQIETLKNKVKEERFLPICFKQKDNTYSVWFISCNHPCSIKEKIEGLANQEGVMIDNVYFLEGREKGTLNSRGEIMGVWINYKKKEFDLYDIGLLNKDELQDLKKILDDQMKDKTKFSIPVNDTETFDLYCKAVDDLLKKKESNTDKNPDSSWFKDNKGKIVIIGVIFTIIILASLASLTISKIKKKKISEKKKNIRKRKKRGRSYKRK